MLALPTPNRLCPAGASLRRTQLHKLELPI
jgi:hypothetical protein